MKKIFIAIAIMLSLGFAFAQEEIEEPDMSVQVIIPENPHTPTKAAHVRIEYRPGLDEVFIYYTCLEVSFKQDEARETIRQCLNDFQLEHGYFGYKYMKDDRISTRKNVRGFRQTTCMTQVKFSK